MAKFIALVRNENLKLRRRKAVMVMLILLLAFALGYVALIGGLTGLFETLFNENLSFSEYCDEQIEDYRQMAQTADPESVSMMETYLLNFQTLKEIGADWDDWRYTTGIVFEYALEETNGDTEKAAELKAIIDGKDYKAYYRRMIAGNETSPVYEGVRYCLEHEIEPSPKNWKYNTAMRMGDYAYSVYCCEEIGETDTSAYETARNEYAIAKYQLEHNIRVNPASAFKGTVFNVGGNDTEESSRFWSVARTSVGMVSTIGLFGIIIAAGMVASEFGKGTVKFLLITPASRWKILLAKYCSLLLHIGMMLLVLFFANLLFTVMFCGGRELFLPILSATGGVVRKSSPIIKLFGVYLLEGIGVVVTSTLAFAISALFRNSAAAVGVSMLVQFGGNLVNTILAAVGADWGRYLIFANVNLSTIQSGVTYYPHQSIGVAAVVIVLHMAVFLLTAFDAFDRREV